MSDTVDAAVDGPRRPLGGEGIGGSVKFVIADEGAVRIDEGGVSADDADADCTITAECRHLPGAARGRARPHRGLHERAAARSRATWVWQ